MTINILACLKSGSSHLRSNQKYDTKSKQLYKKNFIQAEYKNVRMIRLSLNTFKQIAKSRGI